MNQHDPPAELGKTDRFGAVYPFDRPVEFRGAAERSICVIIFRHSDSVVRSHAEDQCGGWKTGLLLQHVSGVE